VDDENPPQSQGEANEQNLPVLRPETVASRQAADPDASQPRPASSTAKMPYLSNRKLVAVNGTHITTAELNQLVAYYQTFRPGSIDLLLRDAVQARLPLTVLRERYKDELPAMRDRIMDARRLVESGTPWAEVVAEYSDDTDEENPEGEYTFGREVAVQPFDRFAHSGSVSRLQGPFLTVYGYHMLEILEYKRGAEAKDDETRVRHILVMYPDLKARAERDEDIRAFIKQQVRDAKVEVLEAGSKNILPPPAPKEAAESKSD